MLLLGIVLWAALTGIFSVIGIALATRRRHEQRLRAIRESFVVEVLPAPSAPRWPQRPESSGRHAIVSR